MDKDNVVSLPPRSNGNPNVIPVNLPEGLPAAMGFGTEEGGLASMDVEAFFNMREWLIDAVKVAGGTVWGAGIGCGQADVSFDLDGMPYNVSIRPSVVHRDQ